MKLSHGGRLNAAAQEYGIPVEQWLDLSTGISPWSWPVPAVPPEVWQRLPEEDDQLLDCAGAYYGCPATQLLAIPGSQFAIRQLPALDCIERDAVALPALGYQEHALGWQSAGHRLCFYWSLEELFALVEQQQVRHAVVINPNNPSAEQADRSDLLVLAAKLAAGGGLLLVDEAFIDSRAEHSLIGEPVDNLVVLRSLGKFFGLAGVRLGFVWADKKILAALAARLDPWAVSHPARWIGARALAASDWQALQRRRLQEASAAWQQQLGRCLPGLSLRATELFVSARVSPSRGQALMDAAARHGLLLRLLQPWPGSEADSNSKTNDSKTDNSGTLDCSSAPALLRFGLPHCSQRDRAGDILLQLGQHL
ncbi:aminotransferase class I/II-fold pyridoxal phosphate-dependent enzyme [Pseudomaricurvus alcaniphilus]|uniref:aminotransferase class I/II-fold pyridoxal phosphate-dependent enzyme n=1 Tax=Pseudomaricurvus alcaniphilus TaxID=1166482 RepID=UPI00140CDA12|nr:aminotransferase class I/II-fold pyridoxal phosphate-dependent enzyme [Pseudomaricurvus alcaniphilus]